MYWPMLKPTCHHGLRAMRSCTIEATSWAATAGTRPTPSSSANENITDTVTSPSPERRGSSSGKSSPIKTHTDSAANSIARPSRSTDVASTNVASNASPDQRDRNAVQTNELEGAGFHGIGPGAPAGRRSARPWRS